MLERQEKIFEYLGQVKQEDVLTLAKVFDVSEVTIRKDLALLEDKGLVIREQGGAALNESNCMIVRLAQNYAMKRDIVKRAAELIQDGETVMIESGSCCILLAEELGETKSSITIITNSAFLASYINRYQNISTTLLGGYYQRESQAVVGPLTKLCIEEFHVNKVFIGTDGFSEKTGFTGNNHVRVETLKAMAGCADKVIVLTESQKFSKQGVVSMFHPGEVQYVYTDQGIPEEKKRFLQNYGVVVETAYKTLK